VLLNEVADGDGVAQVFGRVGHQRAGQRHRVDHGVQAPAQLEGQRVARPRRLRLTVDEVRPASLLVATSVWTTGSARARGRYDAMHGCLEVGAGKPSQRLAHEHYEVGRIAGALLLDAAPS